MYSEREGLSFPGHSLKCVCAPEVTFQMVVCVPWVAFQMLVYILESSKVLLVRLYIIIFFFCHLEKIVSLSHGKHMWLERKKVRDN